MFVLQNISSLAHHRLPLIYCMDGMIKHGTDGAVDQIFRIIARLWARAKRYCHLVNAPPRNSAAAASTFTATAAGTRSISGVPCAPNASLTGSSSTPTTLYVGEEGV